MKRVSVWLLAILLLLTGCAGEYASKDLSVSDISYPYQIKHNDGAVIVTLQEEAKSGVQWRVNVVPEEICAVTEENTAKEGTVQYRVTGLEEGAAQLTFTALRADEAMLFVLALLVHVDADGKVVLASAQHQECGDVLGEAEGLTYKWNVDVDGYLHFSFIDETDNWSVRAESNEICTFSDEMSTSTGCKFTAQANEAGHANVILVGETSQRQIEVVIQVNTDATLEVFSVQEQ